MKKYFEVEHQRVLLPGAGRFPHREAAEEVANHLLGWLKGMHSDSIADSRCNRVAGFLPNGFEAGNCVRRELQGCCRDVFAQMSCR